MHGPLRGMVSQAIGGPNDLSRAHAAARQKGTADVGPMIAAAILIDPRRAPEFAPDHDRHVVEQVTGFQIFDQRSQSLIERWQVIAGIVERRAVWAAVPIPPAIGQADDPCTSFDQPAGRQELVVEQRTRVAIARRLG
jgi:hypothetical protein